MKLNFSDVFHAEYDHSSQYDIGTDLNNESEIFHGELKSDVFIDDNETSNFDINDGDTNDDYDIDDDYNDNDDASDPDIESGKLNKTV